MKTRLARAEVLFGAFLALGSAPAAEVLARAGMDFVIVDLEHGLGDESRVLEQVVAAERGGAFALVRVESAARERAARVLDLGAEGVVCPRVESAEEAAAWVQALRYGRGRGVALGTRGAGFGLLADGLERAEARTVGVVQIETARGVAACEAIARVDGVDVVFVGPTDLSYDLGCFRQWDAAPLREAMARVVTAARGAGKVAGTFCTSAEQTQAAVRDGFGLVAVGTDVSLLGRAAADALAQAGSSRSSRSSAPSEAA